MLEACLSGQCVFIAQLTDNKDRFLQFCEDSRLVLSNTNFRIGPCGVVTRNTNITGTPSPIDHVAMNYRWRGFVQNCRPYWFTCIQWDHLFFRLTRSMIVVELA